MHDRHHDVIVYVVMTLIHTHTDTHNYIDTHTHIARKLSSHKLQIN